MRFLPLVRKNISSEDVKWKYPRKITTRRSDSSPGRRVEINLTSACHFSLDEIILRNELLIKNMTKPINSTHNWVPWSGIKLAWVEYAVCGWDKSKANETCPTSPSFESSSSTWAAHSERERNPSDIINKSELKVSDFSTYSLCAVRFMLRFISSHTAQLDSWSPCRFDLWCFNGYDKSICFITMSILLFRCSLAADMYRAVHRHDVVKCYSQWRNHRLDEWRRQRRRLGAVCDVVVSESIRSI